MFIFSERIVKMCTKKISRIFIFILMLSFSSAFSQGKIIDHTCTDLSYIPAEWIDNVQSNIKVHYAHTSHGGQLTTGLQRIEDDNATYSVARTTGSLPTEADALCIFDGQEHDSYITPDEYWETAAGMNYTRSVLDNNPSINVSMWSWCTQVNSYSESQINAYLDSISTLEAEYPDVQFVYMTGNAQATSSSGYNRFQRNEQIRAYCETNNKVLFDFADLDAWWYNPQTPAWEQNTYSYNGAVVPVEHAEFNGNESGHTTYISCEQKGRTVWWMLAVIAGWDETTSTIEPESQINQSFRLEQNYPNPFNPITTIEFYLPVSENITLEVFNSSGQLVKTLVNGQKEAGQHNVSFDGTNLASGLYYYQLSSSSFLQTQKMLLVK